MYVVKRINNIQNHSKQDNYGHQHTQSKQYQKLDKNYFKNFHIHGSSALNMDFTTKHTSFEDLLQKKLKTTILGKTKNKQPSINFLHDYWA